MVEPMSAQDRLDVLDILARYARCLDTPDVAGLDEVFHADAVLDHIQGKATGHAAIRAWAQGLVDGGRVGASPPQLVHFVGLPLISGDSERCACVTYSLILTYNAEKQISLPLVGSYHDTFEKRNGRWRIAERVIRGDLSGAGARR
jgi:hypothetical protein